MQRAIRPLALQRGAVLLLLVAVLGMGMAAVMIGMFGGRQNQAQAARERSALLALETAREALLGFAVANGRLPRPAMSATDGRETPQPCTSEAACSGFIPWVTLGINGADSWGKVLRYSVTAELSNSPVLRMRAVANRRVLGRDGAGDVTYLAGQAACSVAVPCAAAVIMSSGKNNLGTSTQGIIQANNSAANEDELFNNSAARDFFSRAASGSPAAPGGEFDDLVVWLPLPVLYRRMNAAGVLP